MTAAREAAVTDPPEQPSQAVPGVGGYRRLAEPPAGVSPPDGQGGRAPAASGFGAPGGPVVAAFERRVGPGGALAGRAEQIATAAHAMAVRFHLGGKLVVFGTGAASTDAQHVAVEFVHPVIVGKRALPAISLTSDAATLTGVAAREGMASVFSHQLEYLAEPADIALGIAPDPACPSVLGGLRAARKAGLLTIALAGGSGDPIASDGCADHLLIAASTDPRIIKEVQVTTYHVLWELVHVFFEQPGVLGPGVVT